MIKINNEGKLDDNKPMFVRSMFARIADNYDLMNRIMTFGRDSSWRREIIARANLNGSADILDLGTGTGDIACETVRQCPSCSIVGGDFTITMMRAGKESPEKAAIKWCGCDALCLPFPPETFDVVLSGFLFRNVLDVQQALDEQFRVLRPGGYCVTLDTTPPPDNLLKPVIRFYEHQIIPKLGKWVAGDASAYTFLPTSTAGFLSAERFAAVFVLSGFTEVGFVRKMFNSVAIHWAKKPATA
jgi:demethylmenaquinone methyltransferase/2-methoxy-6-polyprenyl-1,4-benzoquinol methylase